MAKESTDIVLIENYLLKKLSPIEKTNFEARLQNESAFNALYEKHAAFMDVVNENANKDLKQFLQNLESNDPTPTEVKPKSSFKKILSLLALITLLLIGAFWVHKATSTSSTIPSFAEYFQPYPNTLVPVERGESTSDATKTAMLKYLAKDYTSAIEDFDKLVIEEKNVDFAFYKAISHLAINETEKSLIILEELYKNKAYSQLEAVRWYLGLAYLEQSQQKQAKTIFSEIVSSKQKYQRKNSLEILERL